MIPFALSDAEAFFGSPWQWAIIGVFVAWFGLGYLIDWAWERWRGRDRG